MKLLRYGPKGHEKPGLLAKPGARRSVMLTETRPGGLKPVQLHAPFAR